MDDALKKRIEELKILLRKQEEVYASATALRMDFHTLKRLREHINKSKEELQVLQNSNRINREDP